MKKKLLTTAILLVAAIALVVTTMLATMAYLTSTTAVSNTFTVGNITIQMFESKVDSDGNVIETGDKKTADGNSYHLVPGSTYTKDPTIYVAPNSDDCYLFIKVRNQIRSVEDGHFKPDGNDAETMRDQLKANGWIDVYHISNDETIYCYKGTPAEGVTLSAESETDVTAKVASVVKTSATEQAIDLFETFTIDKDAVLTTLGGAKVTITAFAIQGDIKVDGTDALDETATLKELQKLWNIVSGEIEFETVIIPNDVINAATNVIVSPDLKNPSITIDN